MSICLTDIKEKAAHKIVKHKNGKLYINISTWDHDEPDQFENDFSVSIPLSKEEKDRKQAGENIERVFIGNGHIWELDQQQAPPKDIDDLPF